jgi:hypothetical protein
MNYSEKRKHIVAWLQSCLMGPGPQEEDLLEIQPIRRYHIGILFPIIRGEEGIDPAFEDQDEDDENSSQSEDNGIEVVAENTQKKRRYIPPSSAGFSFFIQGENIKLQVQASAVCYNFKQERDKGLFRVEGQKWQRKKLKEDIFLDSPHLKQTTSERFKVFEERAEIYSLWRPYADGWITTISLCNINESPDLTSASPHQIMLDRNEKPLFEAHLKCIIDSGEVGTYPRVDKSLLTEEEQELELQYKHRHIYAVGHGVAADWILNINGRVIEILAEFMPTVEVPQVTADVEGVDAEVLKLEYLSKCSGGGEIIFDNLDRFIANYEYWIAGQQEIADKTAKDDYERGVTTRIVKRMKSTVSRMRQGVVLLRKTPLAALSFGIANQAMLSQMAQYDCSKGQGKSTCQYSWRPFQLAFLLMVIESVINEDSEFRDTVDLIWFPTGGGKTEAYLGLIAFQIIWRRLTNPTSGGGTTVLMRYTLRLLTAQQYLRAARLICALELIRQKRTEFGVEPITVGMWVGEAASPNTFDSTQKIVDQAAEGTGAPPHKLVLDCCPWCHKPFKATVNYKATQSRFSFHCKNEECDFGQSITGILPCNVVDEALYDSPPTLLIATIDKFARLAWDERTTVFFGKNGNRPPELIIQDELHLIAGALGSVAGLYEAALDTVLTQRGVHPKYIASTATIRMADQQIRRLYGRDVAVFPPPGLSFEDSFFARTVPIDVRPGRLYVGYLAPMLGRKNCMAPLAAALLAAPEIVFDIGQVDRELFLEAWWTQVIFHGSLKGVGDSHNAFNIDVREYFKRYVEETKAVNQQDEQKTAQVVDKNHQGEIERNNVDTPFRIAQLTSISSAEENARTFARLSHQRNETDCLDAVLATNMISVGLDVARLALMIINGQPITTAEYIQASSRVGRSDVPGVVFVNYFRDQARSISHYESFRSYHESFYRFVEPTSITPYTVQALMRALHAALVIAIRHSCASLLSNNAAGKFNSTDDCVCKVVETLKRRCERADKERGHKTMSRIDRLIGEWEIDVERCKESRVQLDYQASDKNKATDRLLYNHDDKIKGLWSTLQSMRNVENTALIKQL